MEIIFNESNIRASGNSEEEKNTPDEVVKRFKSSLEKIGNFMSADKVEYKDLNKKEVYIITKGKDRLVLTANGNGFDGGWLGID